MIRLYVIKSKLKGFRYVGITKDLKRRLREHNDGKVLSTKAYRPFNLILEETFLSYSEARAREKFLKSGKGREFLNKI